MKSGTNWNINNILKHIMLLLIPLLCINMTGGSYKTSTLAQGPEAFPLKSGRPSFKTTVIRKKSEIEYHKLRFVDPSDANVTHKEGDIKFYAFNEDGNTRAEVSLEIATEIKILKKLTENENRPGEQFALISVSFKSGEPVELYAPRDIEVCAERADSGLTEAFFLHKIKAITDIQREVIMEDPTETNEWDSKTSATNMESPTFFGKVTRLVENIKSGIQNMLVGK